jgi:RNA polymerase sigma-70 factor (ECF subfamily)
VTHTQPTTLQSPSPQDLYENAVTAHGPALVRLARSYEADPDRRQDLLQEIHFALWRSFASYDSRCSVRTWTYRVAHNVAASHVLRHRRHGARDLVSLDALERGTYAVDGERIAGQRIEHDWLHALLRQLKPLDRQLMLLYLEGFDAASIGEVSGLSPGNVTTKIHRIKKILTDRAREGGYHVD